MVFHLQILKVCALDFWGAIIRSDSSGGTRKYENQFFEIVERWIEYLLRKSITYFDPPLMVPDSWNKNQWKSSSVTLETCKLSTHWKNDQHLFADHIGGTLGNRI